MDKNQETAVLRADIALGDPVSFSMAAAAPSGTGEIVRVTAHREGDANADYRLIQNLARVRVVVN